MKLKITALTGLMLIHIIVCLTYTLFNYSNLSSGKGWGVVAMIALLVMGVIGISVDFILGLILRNKKVQNIVGLIIAVTFFAWIYPTL